jgi:hypothetical protein
MKPKQPEQLTDVLTKGSILAAWGVHGASDEPVPEESYERGRREILAAQRLKSFTDRCPARFLEPFDLRRLPARPDVVRTALAWQGTHPGLWMWSQETGQGKTRVMWQLIRKARVDLGLSCYEWTGQQWADDLWRHWMEGSADQLWWWLNRWDVLCIDDVDKINLSDVRQQRALREFFDLIYREQKPAIITANRPPSWIVDTLGNSAERRVLESFTALHFG